jgi:uncharacterized membrane protein YciS (DUF1049 family)
MDTLTLIFTLPIVIFQFISCCFIFKIALDFHKENKELKQLIEKLKDK